MEGLRGVAGSEDEGWKRASEGSFGRELRKRPSEEVLGRGWLAGCQSGLRLRDGREWEKGKMQARE